MSSTLSVSGKEPPPPPRLGTSTSPGRRYCSGAGGAAEVRTASGALCQLPTYVRVPDSAARAPSSIISVGVRTRPRKTCMGLLMTWLEQTGIGSDDAAHRIVSDDEAPD